MGNGHVCNIVDVESFSSLKTTVTFLKNVVHTPRQLLTVPKRVVAAPDQSSTDLPSTTAVDRISYRGVRLDHIHTTSTLQHISYSETFICMKDRNFHNHTSRKPNNEPYRRRPVRNGRPSSPIQSQRNWQTPLNGTV